MNYAPQVCMAPPVREYRTPWQQMIPHFLKSTGYRSYHSGKWHMFNTKDPESEGGFDKSWGFDIEMYSHFFESGSGYDKVYSATAITDHALECLKLHEADHSGTPFFQYDTIRPLTSRYRPSGKTSPSTWTAITKGGTSCASAVGGGSERSA